MGAHFEALDEGVLLVPFEPRYTQVGFNLVSVHVRLWFARDFLDFHVVPLTCLKKMVGRIAAN